MPFETTLKIAASQAPDAPVYFEKQIGPQEKGKLQTEFVVDAPGVSPPCRVRDEAGVEK